MKQLKVFTPSNIWAGALVLMLVMSTSAVSAQTVGAPADESFAGQVIMSVGTVLAQDPSGVPRELNRNSYVYVGDILVTGPSSTAQVRMKDLAIVSLRENSEFELVAYSYEQDEVNDNALLRLINGGFRTTTGLIGKQNRENYEAIIQQYGAIGIRGTDYEAVITNDGRLVLGIYEGGITFSNAAGSLDLGINANYDFGQVSTPASAPEGLLVQPAELGGIVILPDLAQVDGNGAGAANAVAAGTVLNNLTDTQSAIDNVVLAAFNSSPFIASLAGATSSAAIDATGPIINPNEISGDGAVSCGDGALSAICQPLNTLLQLAGEGSAIKISDGTLALVSADGTTSALSLAADGTPLLTVIASADLTNPTAITSSVVITASPTGTPTVTTTVATANPDGTTTVTTSVPSVTTPGGTTTVITTVPTVAVTDLVPTVTDPIPSVTDPVPAVTDPIPTVTDPVPTLPTGTPTVVVTDPIVPTIPALPTSPTNPSTDPAPTVPLVPTIVATIVGLVTAPITEPTEPVTEPTEPVTEPTEPVTVPIVPITVPTLPSLPLGLALSKPAASIDEYDVSWAKWDQPLDDNWVMVAHINNELVRISTSDYFADVNATPIANMQGKHSFATGIASSFLGRGSAGEINSLAATLDVDFNSGAISNGSLQLQVANQDWLVNFAGSVNAGQVDLNATHGRLIEAGGASSAVNASLDGVFTGNKAEAFVGGFDLHEARNPLNTVEGLYTIER